MQNISPDYNYFHFLINYQIKKSRQEIVRLFYVLKKYICIQIFLNILLNSEEKKVEYRSKIGCKQQVT